MNEKLILAPQPPPDSPVRMHLAGITYPDANYLIKRNHAGIWVLEMVVRGKGFLKVDDQKFQPAAGDCYLLPAYSDHHYHSAPDSPWEKYWFNFSGTLIPDIISRYHLNGRIHFPKCDLSNEFKQALTDLENTQLEQRQHRFAGIIVELLSRISRFANQQESNTEISAEGKILLRLLQEHLDKPIPPLAMLARKINRSESQMLRIFRRDFGMSPVAYLYEKKLEIAKHLLKEPHFPVKAIATKLGFTDELYFSRVFRKKCGQSPREFRNNTK